MQMDTLNGANDANATLGTMNKYQAKCPMDLPFIILTL
jgi:hypothetical protein